MPRSALEGEVTTETPSARPITRLVTPVVAIGATGDNTETLAMLVGELAPELGMVYVVAADASNEQALVELLQKRTPMPVRSGVSGMSVQPDHVYVISTRSALRLFDGALAVDAPENGTHTAPLDVLLTSVADSCLNNAVGVLITNGEPDGVRGLKNIRDAGGWAFVAEGELDSYRALTSEDLSDVADFVLSPTQIARQLTKLRRFQSAALAGPGASRTTHVGAAGDSADRIIGTMDLPLMILNADMRVRTANAAFYDTFHTTPADTEGRLFHELGVGEWDIDALRTQLSGVLHQDTAFHDLEVRHEYPGSSDRTFLLGANRIDRQGEQEGILVTLRDITERRLAERELSRLAAIVTSSADAIMSMDLNGRVLTWNTGAEQLFGYSAASMLGHSLTILLPADRQEEGPTLLERVRQGESIRNFETVRVHSDGHEVQVSLTMSPVRSATGALIGISKSARDITALKHAEQSLRESEQRFHLMADTMDQLAWIAPPEGGSTWYNQRMLDYFGLTGDEIRERAADLHHPDYYPQIRQSLQASIAAGEPWEAIFPLKGRDGTYRWFLTRTSPSRDADGKVLHWFGTSTDISDRMQAEDVLKHADRQKNEFLATLAHELRNPLAPLRSGVDILGSLTQDAALLSIRDVMTRQVDQLVRLVDDLMDLSRITSGRLVLHKRAMNVRDAAQAAIEAVRPALNRKSQSLVEEVTSDSLVIHGDSARVTQVITNLLFNASKYSSAGSTVRLRLQSTPDQVEISVQDEGIGILESLQERVFEMFAQVDPEERGKGRGGLGIGLHIVKRITQMHDGEISVSSPGKNMGSTFTLRLPSLANQQVTNEGEAIPDIHAGHLKVLVVDDNVDSALMLSIQLNAQGCETRVTHSCEEALWLGSSFCPAVVFCDIGMPDVDGYETCRRIRQTDWGAKARILALTGWGQESDRKRSEEAGFDAHFVKPIDRKTLLQVIAANTK